MKKALSDYERQNADDVGNHLSNKDSKQFWKSWNSIHNNHAAVSISVDGQTDPALISNSFKQFYAKIYTDSSGNVEAVNEFKHIYDTYQFMICLTMINLVPIMIIVIV